MRLTAWRTDQPGIGRVLVSFVVAAFVVALAVENFWYAPGARRVQPHLGPARRAGFEQGWGMFVFRPDHPPTAQVVVARLTYADGTVRERPLPQAERWWGAQRAARWQKLGEFARPRSHGEGGGAGQELWQPLARWFAGHAGDGVRRVELLAVDTEIPPIPHRGERARTATGFYDYDVAP
jgi:hypothetical protein